MDPPIVYKAKSLTSSLLDSFKCPLIVDVLSSMVLINVCRSVPPLSWSSINRIVASVALALFSLNLPLPGSAFVVVVSNE